MAPTAAVVAILPTKCHCAYNLVEKYAMVIMVVVLEMTVCIVECSHGGLSTREETKSGTCV